MFEQSYARDVQELFREYLRLLHIYTSLENHYGSDLRDDFNELYACFGCGELISEAQREVYLKWETAYVNELRLLAKAKGIEISRDRSKSTFNSGGKFRIYRTDEQSIDEVIKESLGDLAKCIRYEMRGNTDGFLEFIIAYARKTRRKKLTREIYLDIRKKLQDGISYLENVYKPKVYGELGDFYYHVLAPKFEEITGDAWVSCINYVHDVNLQEYQKAYAKFEELKQLCPHNEYVRYLEGTAFVEGFNTFYDYLLTKSGLRYAMETIGEICVGIERRISNC